MKFRVSSVILFLPVLLFLSCSDEVTEAVPDEDPPEISILSPMDGDTLYSSASIQLEIADDSKIDEVIYYIGDERIGENTGKPFETTWYAGFWGDGALYDLHVTAEDEAGNIGHSDTISLFVHEDARVIPLPYQPDDGEIFPAFTTLTFACVPCPGANQYVLRCPRRDELREHLTRAEIGTEIYYPVPLHLQECFAGAGRRRGDLPESERAADEVLAIPVYPELTGAQLEYTSQAIRDFYTC